MDTSNEYVKMCEKAEEIQTIWKPSIGDYHWRKYTVFGDELDDQIWGNDNCPEITILHTKSSVDGYWFACTKDGEERTFSNYEGVVKCTSIWLPRQDQLQEMIDTQQRDWINVLEMFTIWAFWGINEYTLSPSPIFYGMGIPHNVFSMEQLWLAFVMKEKYGKVWNGEWIKEE